MTARSSGRWKRVLNTLRLSKREEDIVACIVDFRDDDAAIAVSLGLSRHTVHSYFERIYRKVGVDNRCQLVAAVFREWRRDEEACAAILSEHNRVGSRATPDDTAGCPSSRG